MEGQQLDGKAAEKIRVNFLQDLSFLCFQTALRNLLFTQEKPIRLAFSSADGSEGLTPPAHSQTPGVAGTQEFQYNLG